MELVTYQLVVGRNVGGPCIIMRSGGNHNGLRLLTSDVKVSAAKLKGVFPHDLGA